MNATDEPTRTAALFRQQAQRFRQLSATNPDETIARHLREVADDFLARAEQLDRPTPKRKGRVA